MFRKSEIKWRPSDEKKGKDAETIFEYDKGRYENSIGVLLEKYSHVLYDMYHRKRKQCSRICPVSVWS